jgi:hypothetical protein
MFVGADETDVVTVIETRFGRQFRAALARSDDMRAMKTIPD